MSKILAFHTEVLRFEASQMHCRFLFIPHQRQAQNFVDYNVACTGSHIKLKVCCAWYLLSSSLSSLMAAVKFHPLGAHCIGPCHTEAKVVKSCTYICLSTSFFWVCVNHIYVPY